VLQPRAALPGSQAAAGGAAAPAAAARRGPDRPPLSAHIGALAKLGTLARCGALAGPAALARRAARQPPAAPVPPLPATRPQGATGSAPLDAAEGFSPIAEHGAPAVPRPGTDDGSDACADAARRIWFGWGAWSGAVRCQAPCADWLGASAACWPQTGPRPCVDPLLEDLSSAAGAGTSESALSGSAASEAARGTPAGLDVWEWPCAGHGGAPAAERSPGTAQPRRSGLAAAEGDVEAGDRSLEGSESVSVPGPLVDGEAGTTAA